jgi:hypothetical protein
MAYFTAPALRIPENPQTPVRAASFPGSDGRTQTEIRNVTARLTLFISSWA